MREMTIAEHFQHLRGHYGREEAHRYHEHLDVIESYIKELDADNMRLFLFLRKERAFLPGVNSRGILPNRMIKDKSYTVEDAPEYIYLNSQGQLVIQSIFEKHFDGELELLLFCIGYNIFDGLDGKYIDFSMAIDDYRAEAKEQK